MSFLKIIDFFIVCSTITLHRLFKQNAILVMKLKDNVKGVLRFDYAVNIGKPGPPLALISM